MLRGWLIGDLGFYFGYYVVWIIVLGLKRGDIGLFMIGFIDVNDFFFVGRCELVFRFDSFNMINVFNCSGV